MHIGLVIVNASNVVQITGRIIGTINQGNELSSILLRVLRQYGKHVQRHEGFHFPLSCSLNQSLDIFHNLDGKQSTC